MGAKGRQQIADALGIDVEQRRTLSRLLSGGRVGAAGAGADNADVIARQLSVKLDELKLLRAAVNSPGAVNERTRRLLHAVMDREGLCSTRQRVADSADRKSVQPTRL